MDSNHYTLQIRTVLTDSLAFRFSFLHATLSGCIYKSVALIMPFSSSDMLSDSLLMTELYTSSQTSTESPVQSFFNRPVQSGYPPVGGTYSGDEDYSFPAKEPASPGPISAPLSCSSLPWIVLVASGHTPDPSLDFLNGCSIFLLRISTCLVGASERPRRLPCAVLPSLRGNSRVRMWALESDWPEAASSSLEFLALGS